MGLAAGKLNQRVTLLTPAPTVSDTRGGQVASGAATGTDMWAALKPLSGAQLLTLGQVDYTAAYAVTIRFRAGIAAGQRLRWRGDTYQVQRAVPDMENEYLTLTCFTNGK